MDLPADQATHTAVPALPVGAHRRVRRPTGEPPALPRHQRLSGIGWLLSAAVLTGAVLAVFSRGLRSVAVQVTIADDAVVRWLQGLPVPGLTGIFRTLGAPS